MPAEGGGSTAPSPFGVYVHIPFCARRCDYCAFATWTDRHHLHGDYARACVEEIRRAELPPATSLFFGGGTPSLIDPDLLVAIVAAVPLASGAEVTVECNPDTVTPALLDTYRRGGVNRLSFGVQSMRPHVLASLGRYHDPDMVRRAVTAACEAGFDAFNIDLIYGAEGESVADWRHTVEDVLELAPPHVSAYALTVEAGTPLARDAARHPDDDDQAEKYALADDLLSAAGMPWYEVSNWASPGHECRHNRLYWSGDPYRGFGCAAHSFDGRRRWWNVRTPDRYVDLVRAGRSVEAAGEELDDEARRVELLTLALRTSHGVPSEAIAVEDLVDLESLVEESDGRLVLTRAGRLLTNEVALRLR